MPSSPSFHPKSSRAFGLYRRLSGLLFLPCVILLLMILSTPRSVIDDPAAHENVSLPTLEHRKDPGPAKAPVAAAAEAPVKPRGHHLQHSSERKPPPKEVPSWLGTPLNFTRLAFLMETRDEPQLLPLLYHMVSVIPHDWPFLILTTADLQEWLRTQRTVRALEAAQKLTIRRLNPRWKISNGEEVTLTMTDLSFYDHYMPGVDHLLVWQTDSIICSASPYKLEEFLDYDWVGAPWHPAYGDWPYGGNGGLSLRRLDAVRRALLKKPRLPGGGWFEDMWIVDAMVSMPGHNVAPREIASTFAVETTDADWPLGYHIGTPSWDGSPMYGGHIWREQSRREEIFDYCPEVKLILPTLMDFAPLEG